MPVEELQGPTMGLFKRALARAGELGPDRFLSRMIGQSGGQVIGESARELASLYAEGSGAARLATDAEELGVPILALLAADLVGPWRTDERAWLAPDEWLGFATQVCALSAVLCDKFPVLAAQLMDETAHDPADWRFMHELAAAVAAFGASCDEALIPALRQKYGLGMTLIPSVDRCRLLTVVADAIDRRTFSINALLPFLGQDDSRAVVATAALRFAVAIDPEHDDPLTGVRHLIRPTAGPELETHRVAVLSGLLILGDQRVIDLLGPCWRGLSQDGRFLLSALQAPDLHGPLIEWFLDWLEDCEGEEFGAVAAAVALMGQAARRFPIIEIRRSFPVPIDPSDSAIELVQTWSFAEYAGRIEPRLRDLARRETAPCVMPEVLRAWGLT